MAEMMPGISAGSTAISVGVVRDMKYDGLRADRLPAALVQGQRDFFGAHTYQRIDKDGTFHTLWSGDRTEISATDTH